MSEMSAAEALLLNDRRNGDYGFGGDSWIWFILLFSIFGWGGNGLGYDRGQGYLADQAIATKAAVSDGFDFNQLDNGIRSIQNGLCDSTYALKSAIDSCCCTTQRSVDSVKYEMAKGFCDTINANNLNTRDIIEANNHGVQKILDTLCANEKAALRDRIQTLETSGIVQAQTQNLVAQLKPYPVPAYPVSSPYTSYGLLGIGTYNGYGCNTGCGVYNGYSF